jgi:hypothetical protein
MFVDLEQLVTVLLELGREGPIYSPADQRIFPNHLMFVDLHQLFPVQLEDKDLYIYSHADQRIFPYQRMFVDLEQLFPVLQEE